MMLLLTLAACERDPTLTGYWEVVAMRAGGTEDTLAEVTRAGFMEFAANGGLTAMYSYTWSGGDWVPDPRPDLVTWQTDAGTTDDFIEGYKEKGETFSLTLETGIYGEGGETFALEEWKGSSVTLVSDAATPNGAGEGSRMLLEYDLER